MKIFMLMKKWPTPQGKQKFMRQAIGLPLHPSGYARFYIHGPT
jgi:hypothetical protein